MVGVAAAAVAEHDAEPEIATATAIGREFVPLYSEIQVEASVESLMAVEMVGIVFAGPERCPAAEQAGDYSDAVLKLDPQQT